MKTLSLVAGFALLAALSPLPLIAAEKYTLEYKFQPDEKVRWEVVHRATVTTTIQGTTQSAQTKSTSVKVWQVSQVHENGDADFIHWVESIKMTNKLPNRAEIEYDSQADEQPPAGYEDAARAVGVPLTEVRLDRFGKVLERTQRHIQLGNSEDTPIAIPLPSEPIAIGESWGEPHEITVSLQNGRQQKVTTRRRFELKAVEGDIATIGVDCQVLTPIRDPAIEAQLIQRLFAGHVKFDLAQGRLVEQKLDLDQRVLGFSGPASSMHYLMSLEERLLGPHEKLAKSPAKETK